MQDNRLPEEIISHVCSYLEPHLVCSNEENRLGRKTLRSCCLASSHLYAVARQCLYRTVYLWGNVNLDIDRKLRIDPPTANIFQFMRTLLTHEDLRKLVKSIVTNGSSTNWQKRCFQPDGHFTKSVELLITDLIDAEDVATAISKGIHAGSEDFLFVLVLAMCHRLEALTIPSGLWASRTRIGWLLEDSTPHLRHLRDISVVDDGDEEPVDFDEIVQLLCLPSIRNVSLDRVRVTPRSGFLTYDNSMNTPLTSATFSRACFENNEALAVMLQTCPALNSLRIYEANGYGRTGYREARRFHRCGNFPLTFPGIGDAVRSYTTQIEELHLAFSDFEPHLVSNGLVVGTIGSLASLGCLHTLELLDIALLGEEQVGDGWQPHVYDSDDEIEELPVVQLSLASVLPRSLRKLTIIRWIREDEYARFEAFLNDFLVGPDHHEVLSTIVLEYCPSTKNRFEGRGWSINIDSTAGRNDLILQRETGQMN